MSCLECTDCLSIGTFDLCCETITLAQADPATTYRVVITDVTIDKRVSYALTTNGNGDVTLTPDEAIYTTGRTYEVRIYPDDACDFNDPQEMENDLHEDAQTCFSFEFERLT